MHALRCTLQIVTDLLRMELRLRVHRLAVDARSWRAKESVSGVSTPSVTPTHGRWCSPFRAHAAAPDTWGKLEGTAGGGVDELRDVDRLPSPRAVCVVATTRAGACGRQVQRKRARVHMCASTRRNAAAPQAREWGETPVICGRGACGGAAGAGAAASRMSGPADGLYISAPSVQGHADCRGDAEGP